MENVQAPKKRLMYREHESGEIVMRWPGVLAAIGIYFVYTLGIPLLSQFIMAFSYSYSNPEATNDELVEYLSSNMVTLNLITYVATAVILLLVYGPFLWASLKEFFGRMTLSRGLMVIWMPIVMIPLNLIGNVIVSVITAMIAGNASGENQQAVEGMVSEVPMAMVFLTVFMAPFVEEIIFRAAWFRPLWFKSKPAAVILTIILFGLHHVWNGVLAGDLMQLVFIISYIPSTLVLVIAHCSFKNIYGPMILHMAINGFSMFVLVILQPMVEAMAGPAAQQSVGLVTELAARLAGAM